MTSSLAASPPTAPAPLPPPRRWLQFRLRTLMLAMLILPSGLGWLAQARSKSQRAWDDVSAIRNVARLSRLNGSPAVTGQEPSSRWRRFLGIDLPPDVKDLRVSLVTKDERSQIQLLTRLRVFPHLQQLDISWPHRSATAMGPIVHLRELQELYLSFGDGDGTDEDLLVIARLPQLKRLSDANYKRFSDSNIEALAMSATLDDLTLYCDLSKVNWSQFKRLRHLSVGNALGNNVHLEPDNRHDKDLARMASLLDLESLYVQAMNITDEGAKPLMQLKKLKRLRIPNRRMTDAGLATLTELPSLETLEMSGRFVEPEVIGNWNAKRPGLTITAQ